MAPPSVLAILVAHASRTRVGEALRSLGAQTYQAMEIVVAQIGDLKIPDDTGAAPSVIQIRDGVGFGDAVMGVLSTVRAEGFDYVLLLHDDVSLDPDVVERMVNTAQTDPAIAAVGAKLVEWFEPNVLQEVGAAIDRFAIRRSSLDAGEVDAGQRDETSDVLFCSDACLLVSRSALMDVGGMDGRAWPFYEDVDLCWRLREHGARVVVDPQARVRHAADLSNGRRLIASLALREYAEHGRLRFMLKHYAPLGLAVLLPQVFVGGLLRVALALMRRELWRVRVTVGAWMRLFREFPGILADRRRHPRGHVEDRELLALAARGAVGDVRGDRAEWASRLLAQIGRMGQSMLQYARQPATWFTTLAVIAVLLLLRRVIFGDTFALGEMRPLAPFADAISDHFGRVRREGLDPFGPAAPGAVVLGFVRSLLGRAPLAEKVALLAPLLFAGLAGARVGRTLGFGSTARRWIAAFAAVNPVTLALLRDGAVGALVMWASILWLASHLIAPSPMGDGLSARVRFIARWSFGWALAVALHPPAWLWMAIIGVAIVVSRRKSEVTQTHARVRMILIGLIGSFVLLLPWSLQWFSLRSPLVGRPGWLVHAVGGGLERATLGGGWPFAALLLIAIFAGLYVGLDRTAHALQVVTGLAVAAGISGAFPRETALAVAGVSAFLVLAIAAQHVGEEVGREQFGGRQAAAIIGMVALGVVWIGGVVTTIPSGARSRAIPVIAGVRSAETGRVLWLAETTGGVRAWSTLSFAERLGAFPPATGPEERLVTRAIEAANAGRTHRLGGILALADISHIVALDERAAEGLGSQSDIAPQETQGTSTVFRNDAWRGPALILAAPPEEPLSPSGLADVVRDQRRADISGWPFGPIRLRAEAEDVPRSAVVYVAGGARGGLKIEGASARVAAAGAYVPLADASSADVEVPGRWWRWLLPIQGLILVAGLAAWFIAAYSGAPIVPERDAARDVLPARRGLVTLPAALLIGAALAVGWSGISWGIGTPFLSAAWYCPPIGRGYVQRIAVANPHDEGVEYIVRSDLESPPTSTSRIDARARHTIGVAPGKGAVIESYGRRLATATEVAREGAYDSSLCASQSRTTNIFPEGGRAATRAIPRLYERYILYNPFPDLARASVRFVSPDETISPPALQDVSVEPGSVVVVDPEEQFEPMLDLSTTVRVWQGRAIVARRLRTVEQISWSLPVAEIETGVLPRATTSDGITSLIGVNLNDDPVHVTMLAAGRTGSLPEETFEVGAIGRSDFDLNALAPRTKDLVVSLEADAPVAIESLVADDGRDAVSLLPPLAAERRWVVPLAERRELVLVNPTTASSRVRLTRLGPGPEIRDVTVGANRVVRVRLRGTGAFGVLVEASGRGVTAAIVGARGSTPGIPIA